MAEETAGQILATHLKKVPQPLQDVIRSYIKEQFNPFLEGMRAKHGLSEENVSDLTTECLLVLCNVNPIEDLKDELIAEAGLSYETAVRIQRALETDIQTKIMPEAERRGFNWETQNPASPPPAPPPLPAPSLTEKPRFDWGAQKSAGPPPARIPSLIEPRSGDDRGVLYEDSGCRVTPTLVQIGGVSYPTRSIASVIRPLQLPMDFFGGLLLNGGITILGIFGILSFSPIWMLLGAGASLLCGFNVRNEFRRPWWITLNFNNGEEVRVQRQDEAAIQRLYAAIHQAIS